MGVRKRSSSISSIHVSKDKFNCSVCAENSLEFLRERGTLETKQEFREMRYPCLPSMDGQDANKNILPSGLIDAVRAYRVSQKESLTEVK